MNVGDLVYSKEDFVNILEERTFQVYYIDKEIPMLVLSKSKISDKKEEYFIFLLYKNKVCILQSKYLTCIK